MNKVILSGNLARDPEVRYTQSGKAVATFAIAVSRWKRPGENQPTADFFNVVAWDKKAEFCSKYLTKGSRILLEGRLQSRSYEAQDGSKRNIIEVIADEIEFAGAKRQQDNDSGYLSNNSRNSDTSYDVGDMNDHGVDKSGDEIDIPF